MDTKDSNIKSQQTGGLKLMTVFIVVLALHIVVIGGITVYHLMSGGGSDADLVTTDKTHKTTAMADGSMPDANQGDKSAPAPATSPEVAATPATPLTPAPAAPTEVTTPTTTPAPTPTASTDVATGPTPGSTLNPAPAPLLTPTPALTLNAPKPLTLAPPVETADPAKLTTTAPIPAELVPPAEPASAPIVPVPAPSVLSASGPVHMPVVAAPEPVHQQIYVVKITDSYKKIAHAHHVTVAQLKDANHIKGDVLHTGQKLVIPSSKTLVATTASATSLDATPAPAASLAPAPTTGSSHRTYTIVKGDTLSKIARRFKTTSTALMAENNITDPTKLTIGKKLKIPSQELRSAKNSAPASTPPGQVQAKENTPTAQLANFVP